MREFFSLGRKMSVYRALWAMRFLPKFAGAAPFDLTRTSLKFSRLGQIWSLLQLTIAAIVLYVYRSKILFNYSDLYRVLDMITTWLQYLIAIYSVLKDGLCQQAMIDVVRIIDQFDENTGYNNDVIGRRENERVRMWSFLSTILLVVLAIGRFLIWETLELEPSGEIFIMQIDNSIIMFVVTTFLLGLRHRHLNSMVEHDRRVKVQAQGSENVANAEYVRVLYSQLIASGDRLNEHYSARLFLWSTLMMFLLITRYYGMIIVKGPSMTVLATITKTLPAALGILVVSVACEFTTVQINKTPAVLLEKSIRGTALVDRGRKELFTLSLYMALQPFEFSALGFFSVDLKLLHTVIGVTSTYLTLCLQTNFPIESEPPSSSIGSNSSFDTPKSNLTTSN